MEKINKKGASHIEIILSFVIFIGFIIFLFAVIKPFKSAERGEIYLEVVERGIINQTSTEINSIPLKINYEFKQDENCFSFVFNGSLKNIIAKDENSDIMEAKSLWIDNGEKKEIIINSNKNFSYVYSSEEFNESIFDITKCKELNKEDYTIGLFRKEMMISESKMNNFYKKYNESYDNSKKDVGLPSSKDFAFSIRDTSNNAILIANKKVPKGVNVWAKDIPIRIAYNNGTFVYAMLNVQTW